MQFTSMLAYKCLFLLANHKSQPWTVAAAGRLSWSRWMG